jgi:hypothetical protein
MIDFKTDPTFRDAMEKYKALIPYFYPFHATKSWMKPGALLKTASGDVLDGGLGVRILPGNWDGA